MLPRGKPKGRPVLSARSLAEGGRALHDKRSHRKQRVFVPPRGKPLRAVPSVLRGARSKGGEPRTDGKKEGNTNYRWEPT